MNHFKENFDIKKLLAYTFLVLVTFYFIISMESHSQKIYSMTNSFEEVSLFLIFAAISTLFFYKNRTYQQMWLIKLFITYFVMIAYEMHYGLDSYRYYYRAITDSYTIVDPGGTGNIEIFTRYLSYILGDSYYSIKLFYSLLAFIGLILIYKAFIKLLTKSNICIKKYYYHSLALFLTPTILFWSSILGKDSLNIFFVGLFTYSYFRLIEKYSFSYFSLVVFSIIGVGFIRSWMSGIFVIAIAIYFIEFNSKKSMFLFLILGIVLYFLSSSFLTIGFMAKYNIMSMESLFLAINTVSSNLSYGNSKVEVYELHSIGDYIFYFIPNFFTAVFRPQLYDAKNPFMLLAAIENTILLYFFLKYFLLNLKVLIVNKYIKFLVSFIFAWSLLYVIISPTNLGMAVRFKLQIMPALIMVILYAYIVSVENRKKKKALV